MGEPSSRYTFARSVERDRYERVVWATHPFMNGHGPRLFAPRVGEVAKAGISAREHRQGGRHMLMPRAVTRFERCSKLV